MEDSMSHEISPSQPTLLTQEGLAQLEAELQHLRSTKRREVALRIKRAAELGDRSENSEYEDAKNEQAFVEGRIQELDRLLRNVEVIDGPSAKRPDVVAVGCTVEIVDTATGERFTYTIVGPVEVDPAQGRISHVSPVGAALMGRAPGDTVRVEAPAGTLHLRVNRIQ
jgi:transcription elongation factor GreA